MYQKRNLILIPIFLFAFIFYIFCIYTPLMANGDHNGERDDDVRIVSPYGGIISGRMDDYDDDYEDYLESIYYQQPSYLGGAYSSYPYTRQTTYPGYTGFGNTYPTSGGVSGWSPYAISQQPTYTYKPSTYATGWGSLGYTTPTAYSYQPYGTVLRTTTPLSNWTSPTYGYSTSGYYQPWSSSSYLTTPSYYSSGINFPTTSSSLYPRATYPPYSSTYSTNSLYNTNSIYPTVLY